MHVLIMQGPNLNRLGAGRPTEHYGVKTLAEVQTAVDEVATELGATTEHFQSNHEGALIDWLQERIDASDGVIVNPAGLTYYGDSFRTALIESALPVGLVHISNVYARDDIVLKKHRQHDIYADVATFYTAGLGWRGYGYVLRALVERQWDLLPAS
jgi:3-dehydroquinate dehydratase-2